MGRLLIRLIAAYCFIFHSLMVEAHPGIGMIYDGNSIIYYTDLEHIWGLDLSVGEASVLIPNIHSHELCMDSLGNLYGEHYYYVENEQKFKNYIWKYSNEGDFSILRPEQEGENNDFSFIRDQEFNAIQFTLSDKFTEIRKVLQDSSHLIAKQEFQDLRWKSVNEYNELFLIDLHSLYKIDHSNKLELLAKDLSETKFPFSFNDEKHNVYGVWSDDKKNTYVAIYGGRCIKRIDENNNIRTIYKSSLFWSPLNGLFDKDGQLWVLEASLWGNTRVSLIKQSDEMHTNCGWIWAIIALILIVLAFIVNKRKKGNRQQRV